MKKTALLILTATLVLTWVGLSMAEPDGNHRKGKYVFRKDCRSCHMEGATGAKPGKILEPITFTRAEWDSAFSPDKAAAYACHEEWKKVSAQDIKDIYTYMWTFAKDSPEPASCK